MQTGAATPENSLEVPQKIKIRITLWPSNCTTRYLSKEYKNTDLKGHMHSNVYSSTIDRSHSMERAQTPIDGWVDKEDVVYVCTMEYYLAMKKNEILPFATMWLELECIMLSEISQKKIYYFTHIWNLRYKIDEHKEEKQK